MPRVCFLGKVFPDSFLVSISMPPILWEENSLDLKMEFHISVNNSAIKIDCDVNNYEPKFLETLYMRAFDLVRAAVNILAFKNGIGHTILLDTFINEVGVSTSLAQIDRTLASLSTVFDLNSSDGYNEAIKIIISEPALFMALDDLIASITLPHHSPVNCARAIEGIRHMISSEKEPKDQWPQMHSALKTSKAYVQMITDYSAMPRHGNRMHIGGEITGEITKRAWVIMNRFLEYRKRGNTPLPESDFPILKG